MAAASQFAHVTISPDMRIHVEGYGDMTEDVAMELAKMRHEEEQELASGVALARQQHIAKETGAEIHGAGKHGLRVAAQIDGRIVAYWERRYGRAFFTDKSNMAWFIKRHPDCGVKYIPKLFGYTGPVLAGKATSKADRMTISPMPAAPAKPATATSNPAP